MGGSFRRGRRHPARVYWVRRALVLALSGLLVCAGVWWIDGDQPAPDRTAAGPGGARRAAAAGSARPADRTGPSGRRQSSGARPSTPGATDRVRGPRAGPAVVTAHLAAADRACDPAVVLVEPSVPDRAVAGAPVRLQLRMGTRSGTACRFTPTPDSLLVQVSNGGEDPVWEATRCPETLSQDTLVLRPGWQSVVMLTWSGLAGARDCSAESRPVPPGRYAVQAAVLGGEPDRGTFELAAPEPPRPPHRPGDEGSRQDRHREQATPHRERAAGDPSPRQRPAARTGAADGQT